MKYVRKDDPELSYIIEDRLKKTIIKEVKTIQSEYGNIDIEAHFHDLRYSDGQFEYGDICVDILQEAGKK